MKNVNSTDFARIVTTFLTDYLPLQRCYSKNTILSYRDTLKLFLRFISEEKGMKLKSFRVSDFTRETVIEFLEWYRQKGAKSSAANQRLAAIKTFADYAQLECIDCISPLQEIAAIKAKRSTAREIEFLTVEQVSLLINRPNVNTSSGLRHRAALTLLYDSGCRVQELCDLTVADISLNANPTIRLHGKGDKYRTVPIRTCARRAHMHAAVESHSRMVSDINVTLRLISFFLVFLAFIFDPASPKAGHPL